MFLSEDFKLNVLLSHHVILLQHIDYFFSSVYVVICQSSTSVIPLFCSMKWPDQVVLVSIGHQIMQHLCRSLHSCTMKDDYDDVVNHLHFCGRCTFLTITNAIFRGCHRQPLYCFHLDFRCVMLVRYIIYIMWI